MNSPMTAPSIREALLREARQFVADSGCDEDDMETNQHRDDLLARIDAALSAPLPDVVEVMAQPDQSKIGMLLLDFANGFECDDVDFARTTGAILINSAAEAARTPPDPLDNLVARFSVALLEKLKAAREKYGFSREHWRDTDWMESCQRSLVEHLAKGDPRDVAAYCAFMWHHGWKTAAHPDESAIRADERERCAKIADDRWREWRSSYEDDLDGMDTCNDIAAAIRAGGMK